MTRQDLDKIHQELLILKEIFEIYIDICKKMGLELGQQQKMKISDYLRNAVNLIIGHDIGD